MRQILRLIKKKGPHLGRGPLKSNKQAVNGAVQATKKKKKHCLLPKKVKKRSGSKGRTMGKCRGLPWASSHRKITPKDRKGKKHRPEMRARFFIWTWVSKNLRHLASFSSWIPTEGKKPTQKEPRNEQEIPNPFGGKGKRKCLFWGRSWDE